MNPPVSIRVPPAPGDRGLLKPPRRCCAAMAPARSARARRPTTA